MSREPAIEDRTRGREGPQALGHRADLDAPPSVWFYEKGESELAFIFFLSLVNGSPFPIPTEVAHAGNNITQMNPNRRPSRRAKRSLCHLF